MVTQVKTQCTTDIKKRDLQIERLKSHLQGQQRGNKSTLVAPSISISGGSGGSRSAASFRASVKEVRDPEYSLTQETNEFLTQLSQSLSDENDTLIAMVRNSLFTLKQLLGLDTDLENTGNGVSAHDHTTTQMSYEDLAHELQTTTDLLKSLLTNPNFVSVEEVDVRDEEIARLREGWERMETRWKDVLIMMDGWRKRLEKTGDTINLDDLKRGLGLGVGLEQMPPATSPARPHRVNRHSLAQIPGEEDNSDCEGNGGRDSGVSDMTDEEALRNKHVQRSAIKHSDVQPPDFFDLRPVKGQKLRQLSNNFQSPRRVAFEDGIGNESSVIQDHEADVSSRSSPSKLPRRHIMSPEPAEEPTISNTDGAPSPRPRFRVCNIMFKRANPC